MDSAPGLSVRFELTLSYAGFLMLASALLLAAVWVFLLRYVPEVIDTTNGLGCPGVPGLFVPNRSDLMRAFAPKAARGHGVPVALRACGTVLLAGACSHR